MTDRSSRAKAQRIANGRDQEARIAKRFGLQSLLERPLLETVSDAGARARPRDLYHDLADRMGLSLDERTARKSCTDQDYNVFEQQVRWTRQTLVAKGMLAGPRGVWELTEKGRASIAPCPVGTTILIYSLDDGLAFLARAEDAAAIIEEESLSLVVTSPPYPIIRREYGRMQLPEWMEWMSGLVGLWKRLLRPDGTLAVNLMDVHVPGSPTLSTYIERFTLDAIDQHGFHLAGRMPWHSPTKLANLEWAVKRGVQMRNSVEHVILLSKTDRPNWDATRIDPEAYAARSPSQLLSDARRAEKSRNEPSMRPSGLDLQEHAFMRKGEGRLASNLIIASGASGNDAYARRCKQAGIMPHPARFPEALPRKIIQLATMPGEVVYDPMSGSNTTGKVALDLGRRFIATEPIESYVRAGAMRFDQRSDFIMHG